MQDSARLKESKNALPIWSAGALAPRFEHCGTPSLNPHLGSSCAPKSGGRASRTPQKTEAPGGDRGLRGASTNMNTELET